MTVPLWDAKVTEASRPTEQVLVPRPVQLHHLPPLTPTTLTLMVLTGVGPGVRPTFVLLEWLLRPSIALRTLAFVLVVVRGTVIASERRVGPGAQLDQSKRFLQREP